MTSADPPSHQGAGPAPVLVPEAVAVDHHFDADGLYTLRATLAAHADHLGATADAVEKLLIVGSELATNAVRHGGGTGRFKMWGDGPYLRCQISDQGPGLPDPSVGTRRPDATTAGGWGLWISRQLCDDFIIDTGADGTTVTVAITMDSTTADHIPGPR